MTSPSKFHRYGEKGRRGLDHPNRQKTHCPHGHPYDKENTRLDPQRNTRSCRECGRIKARKRRNSKYERGSYKRRVETCIEGLEFILHDAEKKALPCPKCNERPKILYDEKGQIDGFGCKCIALLEPRP